MLDDYFEYQIQSVHSHVNRLSMRNLYRYTEEQFSAIT